MRCCIFCQPARGPTLTCAEAGLSEPKAPSLADFEPLTAAEKIVLDRINDGAFERIGVGVPDPSDEARIVRAALIRFLLLGGPGAPKVHEKGIRLSGALIEGPLDLEGCRINSDLGLVDCRLDEPIILRSAVLRTLFLSRSHVCDISAERLQADGDVNISGAQLTGEIEMPGARIGGNIVADRVKIGGAGTAIDLFGAHIGGSVLLRGGASDGSMRIRNAKVVGDIDAPELTLRRPDGVALDAAGLSVGGNVNLHAASIIGESRLEGADVAGDLDLSGGTFAAPGRSAMHLSRATIRGALIMTEGARLNGLLDLGGANLGLLVDDPKSWPGPGDLSLNRCLYGAILGGPVDAVTRLKWLALQAPERWGEDFWPQPFEQLSDVLVAMGHNDEAQRVMFEKEKKKRQAQRIRARSRLGRWTLAIRDAFLGLTVGYGRRAHFALIWLAALWTIGALLLVAADTLQVMRPNAVIILRSPDWMLCGIPEQETMKLALQNATREGLAAPGQSQLACWRAQPESKSYPRFNPWMFAVDATLPAVSSGQRDFWSPDSRFWFGMFVKNIVYFMTIAGWALSLLAVAAFSGLVRSR